MDRMIDDMTRSWGVPAAARATDLPDPAFDVAENDEALTVKADLPGVDEKDVEVVLDGSLLTIRGEKRSERDEEKDQYHLVERSHGSFTRSFRLPFDPADGVRAAFDKGVLTVTLPKPPEARSAARRIEIGKPS
ncbi:Hsp20/alpha crystallin family protein [Azospirillum sp. RWY-5-1]|uniref:Hsp20/alpha crystallin family protein n=2 Tax=Azospirillum oleiclasticum TaxID=2735135 RepID=A0ABX2TCN3_9PROT|nr:Hsp20/alpha crystallin family protein [Azospirillum oleiclasticum]NYZ21924.1 Hsp20/alpha crystallin family protein [Azospirillum oleiclasticum]